ncbi:MAG: hydantoinase B/oxoprolinase family protein [Fastidiosipilaceae bacterium]|jgi:N-methylhydantoinase B
MSDNSKIIQDIDPFTLEIVKDSLVAIGDEMFYALQRTSKSTIIYEVLDYASGLTDSKGRLLAQGNGVTGFLGTLDFSVKDVIEKFAEKGNLHPGDIIITNDPYGGGGTHLSDVCLAMPIFYDRELVAFSANKAHWTEVGGKDPGSWTTDSTEVYQEGLQFPCIKIFEEGKFIQSLIDLIAANVRMPDMTLGDLWAGVAALRVGERRFIETCDKYGKDTVMAGIEKLLDNGEQLTRLELAKLPHGVFEAEDYIDDDGLGNGPFRVCVKVTVTDDQFICDFRGSHPQVLGPVNCSYTALIAGARAIFKALTNPAISANEGTFRPLKVISEPRTIFTAERPAAVSTYWETMLYVTDLIWRAMAPVVPDRLTAGHFLSVCADVLANIHPDTGELALLVEPTAGGWGAGRDKDGENGLVCIGDGETYTIPVEVAETRYGFLVDQYALNTAGGGAGECRGGAGVIRDYRILADEAHFTATFGRHKYLPWGMKGGKPGTRNEVNIISAHGEPDKVFGKCARLHMRRGDVARLITGCGGGYGEPYKRPVEKVQDDVKNGYISIEQAWSDYGVRLAAEDLAVLELAPERES